MLEWGGGGPRGGGGSPGGGGGGPHHCMSILSNPSVVCLCCSVIIKLHVKLMKAMSHVTLFLPTMLDVTLQFV